MTFGERLRQERKAQQLTQEVISGLCGISQHTWSKYETDVWHPKFERITTIADLLGVSADYLLGRTDERKNISL